MKLDEIVGLLERVPLFEGLSSEELNWISLSGEPVIFTDGRMVILDNEPGEAGYLILSGQLNRINGPGIYDKPQQLGPGTFIGEMAMLIETDHSSTIITEGEVRALKFTRSLMNRLMCDQPGLAEHFAEKIRARFQRFADQLKEIEQSFESDADEKEDTANEMASAEMLN